MASQWNKIIDTIQAEAKDERQTAEDIAANMGRIHGTDLEALQTSAARKEYAAGLERAAAIVGELAAQSGEAW